MRYKYCMTCGVLKVTTAFYRRKGAVGGRAGSCKECRDAAVALSRQNHLEEYKAKEAARALKNREKNPFYLLWDRERRKAVRAMNRHYDGSMFAVYRAK